MTFGQHEVFKIYHFLGNTLYFRSLNPINISTSPTPSPALLTWSPAAWLRVSGDDAFAFLQGQFTNDLRGLERGPSVYGLWLSVRGKVLADSFVAKAADGGFWVGSYFCGAATIRERLEAFVIADDVVIEDVTADWAGLTLFGGGVAGRLAGGTREGLVFPGRRVRSEHVEWVMPRNRIEMARQEFADVQAVDEETATAWRITDGVPAVPHDIGPADLPNEGGLEHDAISYTKGCYLGQEVMARLKSMGQVRRRLLRVRVETEHAPAAHAPLFAGARQVGELRSVARDPAGGGFVALAMVSLLHVKAESQLALAAEGAANVRLLEAP